MVKLDDTVYGGDYTHCGKHPLLVWYIIVAFDTAGNPPKGNWWTISFDCTRPHSIGCLYKITIRPFRSKYSFLGLFVIRAGYEMQKYEVSSTLDSVQTRHPARYQFRWVRVFLTEGTQAGSMESMTWVEASAKPFVINLQRQTCYALSASRHTNR